MARTAIPWAEAKGFVGNPRCASLLQELRRRYEGSDTFPFRSMWNDKQRDFIADSAVLKVICGGNGCSKTTLGSYIVSTIAQRLDPASNILHTFPKHEKPVNIYCAGTTLAKTKGAMQQLDYASGGQSGAGSGLSGLYGNLKP